ncbi:cadherin-AgCad1 [Procambarus clarkii]|uniref:cadherin-AgCad1 n=1 Tax=Procambarus clarkii TaxID=6728 RepID=UPI003742FBDB
MILARWVVVLVVGVGGAEAACSGISWINEACIEDIQCTAEGNLLTIWEDCAVGTDLFTYSDTTTLLDNCIYFSRNDQTVSLKVSFNAETDNMPQKYCRSDAGVFTQFTILDVNEFDPLPVDMGQTYEVQIDEEIVAQEITVVMYTDDDYKETETLNCEMTSTDYKGKFTMTKEYQEASKQMKFSLNTLQPLDFEELMFYKLTFKITSIDDRKATKEVTQTILVSLNDVGDNPPYWVHYNPTYDLQECEANTAMFKVEARDRDVVVNNAVQYSITDGNDDNYFTIDAITGDLSTNKQIDREALVDLGITSFTITITAQEYKNGAPIDPNSNITSSNQVIVIYIVDINDNSPTFSDEALSVEIPELTDNAMLPLAIYVIDMDERESGHYTLTSSSGDIVVSPTEGRGNTTITLTAMNAGTTFDYETQQNKTLSFTITATEVANVTHLDNMNLLITLSDVNDNIPTFSMENYYVPVQEISAIGKSIVTVEATDTDISPEFNTESIRYYLTSCTDVLDIDGVTGEVTLTSTLDFETKTSYTCDVEARDELGSASGNTGNSQIHIIVQDVVDEPPRFTSIPSRSVEENSAAGTAVGTVQAEDKDASAEIVFNIDYENSKAYKDDSLISIDISGWFSIATLSDGSSPGAYSAEINIFKDSPDREKADRVTLQLVVVDSGTQVNANTATGSMDITILDVNDSPPEFIANNYDQISVKENSVGNTIVATIKAKDPDVNDNVTFSIMDQPMFYLGDVDGSSGVFQVDLLVREDAHIDRETLEFSDVLVTIMDSAEHPNYLSITVTIIDMNDETPVMSPGVCNITIDVPENSLPGYFVTSIAATDADQEGAHKEVKYLFLNQQLPDEKNLHLPFELDSVTGQVTVSGNYAVDRETYSDWELLFVAYDGCELNELDCKVRQSNSCHIFINVIDVNDNPPENFQWTPNDDPLVVNEFMVKGEEASTKAGVVYEISAHDGDQENTNNALLTYEVLSTGIDGRRDNINLFEAVNKNRTSQGLTQYFCTLRATKNLTELKGLYDIEIMAKDHGVPTLNGTTQTIRLNIEDANDNTPTFRFEDCVVDDVPTVRMQEGAYVSGQDISCTTDSGEVKIFKIYVDDADDGLNKEVTVDIDFNKTQAEGTTDGVGQMKSFILYDNGGYYTLQVTEPIDKEKGSAYTLSLHVVDKGTPPLQSSSLVRVIVTNKFEFPPYFDQRAQTLYMIENDPNVQASFLEAIDLDNTNVVNKTSDDYDRVYYQIIEGNGDSTVFSLVSSSLTELQLRNRDQGLDRETKPNYSLQISTFNRDAARLTRDDATNANDTLYVTIVVQDENDNPPVFQGDKVIFASFSPSDNSGKTIATIQASDKDLNETLHYRTIGDFQWYDTNITPENPFSVADAENNTAVITLQFLPIGSSSGYCTFTITVVDAVGQEDSAQAKVYAITSNYQLPVYFNNFYQDVYDKQDEVQNAFTMAYGYQCLIDSIAQSTTDSGEPIDDESTVLMHFINDETHTPVPVKEILDASNDAAVVQQLLDDLHIDHLNLKAIGTIDTNTGGGAEQQLLVLQVLLGVVSLVLGSLCLLLITVYCIRTRSLKLRVKVLSTNTFGSQSSELNRVGTELAAIPGSNKFTGEGANPMYNMADSDLRNDSSSIGSGDSVLVGIEDNPEFKNKQHMDVYSGFENGAFGRSIDQVSAPSALSGGSRTNPLLQLQESGEDHDLADGVPDYNFGKGSESNGSDDESFHKNVNSNFSFGN